MQPNELVVNLWTRIHSTAIALSKAWAEYIDRKNWITNQYYRDTSDVPWLDKSEPNPVLVTTCNPSPDRRDAVNSAMDILLRDSHQIPTVGPHKPDPAFPIAKRCRLTIRWIRGLQGQNVTFMHDRSSQEINNFSETIAAIVRDAGQVLNVAAPTGPSIASAHDQRDKWIYTQAIKGTAWASIKRAIDGKPQTWERIETENGVKDAAKRYAQRHGLPMPPPRKRGRPNTK